MTIAQQQHAGIELDEVSRLRVDFSDEPMQTGEISLRNKLLISSDASATAQLIAHALAPYHQTGAHIAYIDTKGTLTDTALWGGARCEAFTAEMPFQFNPFVNNWRSDYEHQQSICRLIMALWKPDSSLIEERQQTPLEKHEQNILKAAVCTYCDQCGHQGIQQEFNSFYDYFQADIVPTLTNAPADTLTRSFDYTGFMSALKPYYKGGEYDYLLNGKTSPGVDVATQNLFFDISGLQHQPFLSNLVTILLIESLLPLISSNNGIRKLLLINTDVVALSIQNGYETYRSLIKVNRLHFGETWLIVGSACSPDESIHDISNNSLLKCFSTAWLMLPALDASSTNQWIQVLSHLVEARPNPLTAGYGDRLHLPPAGRLGFLSLTSTGIRYFLLPA